MNRVMLLALTALTLLLPTPRLCAEPPIVPDTTAGRLAEAFITAFNSGNDDTMRAFESTHRAVSALKDRSIDARVKQYHDLFERWGRLRIKSITDTNDLEIALLVEGRKLEHWLRFEFDLEESPPHGLIGVMIQGPIDPEIEGIGAKTVDGDKRKLIVDRIADELIRGYVFADMGKKLGDTIRKNLATGQYDDVESVYAFTRRLTNDLQEICHDKHLRVRPRAPRPAGSEMQNHGPGGMASANYGFEKISVLPGNIGYIKLNGFADVSEAESTATAAMTFLANTDALIFDLRENGGGSPGMINFLAGYLYNERTLMNRYDHRLTGLSESWSRTDVPGPHYGEKRPVYILTSKYTFSAAEEFSYDMKHLKRAQLVGETTGGGAHPVEMVTVNKYVEMSLPFGRAVNPITGKNWEGVGVIPHVSVAADKALETARKLARDILDARDSTKESQDKTTDS